MTFVAARCLCSSRGCRRTLNLGELYAFCPNEHEDWEAVRKFGCEHEDVFKCVFTANAIFFVVKQSHNFSLIKLSILSVKTTVLSEKNFPIEMSICPTGGGGL